jgi:hypothetical protein
LTFPNNQTHEYMRKTILFTIFLLIAIVICEGQNYFRSGIFLHHSTGGCIWGPNGSNTSVPQEMGLYNTAHGYTGSQAISMDEEWWAPGDNEWTTQHTFFEDPSPVSGIGYYLPGNKIIVVKTCFPASAMSGAGQPSDTLYPEMKTVYNYKWHWRHIVRVMKQHPENFFVIWTNAPLEPASTNTTQAALSKWFCTWANDTLATGLDPEFGAFPQNVHVFDFFRKLTGPGGMMLSIYAAGPGDSHPNAAATALVAPQFVEEIFDSSIGYEVNSGIQESGVNMDFPITVSPNPCREETVISFVSYNNQKVEISLFDQSGKMVQKIVDGYVPNGLHAIPVSFRTLNQGAYHVRCILGTTVQNATLLVTR